MKTDAINSLFEPRRPKSYVVIDLESAVLDDTAHKRYQSMERWVPTNDDQPGRRGYTRAEDPLRCPRWPFQTIVTAVAMVLSEHPDGNLDVARFVTMSAPDHDERAVIAGILQVLDDAPEGTEMVSWGGMMHDVPLLLLGAMRHGLTLPKGWGWMSLGGSARSPHIDFARSSTGGFKMKPVHESEILAALDIPAKVPAPAFAVARLIYAQQWDTVQECCEFDVIATAMMLVRWRKLHDPRVEIDTVEDRILRRVSELRAGRGYVATLEARRAARFGATFAQAANDAGRLAPWLDQDAA